MSQAAANKKRPKYLSLTALLFEIHLPLAGWVSILHRISGALLFALLVPGEAHQQHLDILANVARLFSQASFCEQLRAARDNRSLFEIATGQT